MVRLKSSIRERYKVETGCPLSQPILWITLQGEKGLNIKCKYIRKLYILYDRYIQQLVMHQFHKDHKY